MSESKIAKDIAKLSSTDESIGQLRDVLLLSDSKGKYIKRQIQRNDIIKLEIICSGGAKIDNAIIRSTALRKIQFSRNPIVLVWFGTCEFTDKNGSCITISEEAIGEIDRIFAKYEKYKKDILSLNNRATVIFLECPPVSISKYKQSKGIEVSGNDLSNDERLLSTIKDFNTKLHMLNEPYKSPKISQDVLQGSKKKGHQIKYKINFNLFLDGFHPGALLTKLWLYRFYSYARQLSL